MMSRISSRLIYHCPKNLLFSKRALYTGPESTPDFTGKVNEENTLTAKKFRKVFQRMKDLHEGKTFTNPKDRLVEEGSKFLYDVEHSIFTQNPEKYHVEVANKYTYDNSVIGNTIRNEDVVGESDTPGKMDPDFIKPEVLNLLHEITERDPLKVHKFRPGNLPDMPNIRLLTDKQLQEEFKRKDEEAKEMLKIPPVMLEREEIDDVLAHDHNLDGYESANLVFTDISEDLPDQERFIVVRETDGKLRKAKWEERDRLLQVYYPKPLRSILKPVWTDDLSIPLSNKFHLNTLEQIYGQFETDSYDYIRLTQQVYDHIDHNQLYDLLRSTRFYGCMVFYFAKHSSIDGLLQHMLNQQLLEHAAGLVKLYTLIKPQSKTAEICAEQQLMESGDHFALIQAYVENDCKNLQALQMTLKTLEMNNQQKQQSLN